MTEVPERHPGVPSDAVWRDDLGRWERGPHDAAGARHGPFEYYRPDDGTLYMRCAFVGGLQQGAFEILHPDGAVARRGLFVDGEIDGLVNAFASEEETPERLRGCCVPSGAWEMRARYVRGELQGETFYDREGFALLSDGSRRPERPAAVPEGASYDEFSGRWAVAPDPASGPEAPWRYYTRAGTLDEETVYRDLRREAVRRFSPDGRLWLETRFVSDGLRDGGYLQRFVPPGPASPFADSCIVEVRGAHEAEQPVGPWTFHDATGAVVRAVDRGRAYDEADCAGMAVFRDERKSAEEWLAMAGALRRAGRTREAICAAARGAAQAGEARPLRAFLDEAVVPLRDDEAMKLAEEATEEKDGKERGLAPVLSALVAGGDAAALLRALAGGLTGASQAALDFVEASLLLAPERVMTHLTRALIRIELGDDEGALADAQRLAGEAEETAAFLRDYVRLLFPRWVLPPGAATPDTSPLPDMPDEPAQGLAEVRAAIAVYVTRLARLRALVSERLEGRTPAWLPPDLTALLPDGAVPLRRYTATITDETDEGPETVEVQIDETLPEGERSVPVLMRLARAAWAGLGWLCWSAGLDRVALPEEVKPPANFGAAIGAMLHRFFRAQDVIETGGLRSLTAGVPGFVWEWMEIDGMPRPFVQMASDELYELRALFLWLASPENLSPFQSDLRQV